MWRESYANESTPITAIQSMWRESYAEPSLRKRSCARPPKYLRIPNALRLND